MPDVRAESLALAGRVLTALAQRPERSAWELKMELKVSHTRLHLALGMLLERGEIALAPERLTFRVRRADAPPAAEAAAAAAPAAAPVS